MKIDKMRLGLPLVCLVVLIFSFGCVAKYTMHHVKGIPIKPNSSIAISVLDKVTDEAESNMLEAYLITSFMAQGYQVRPFRLELLFGRSLSDRIWPADSYVRQNIGNDKESTDHDVTTNEKTEDNGENPVVVRVPQAITEAVVKLTKSIPEVWGVEYLLVVQRFEAYGYSAYVVDLANLRIINGFVFAGNRDGFIKALGHPHKGEKIQAEDGDETHVDMMRIAEYLAHSL